MMSLARDARCRHQGANSNVSYGPSPQDVICPPYKSTTSNTNRSDAREVIRRDAALLFLIYPLQIVEGQLADRILADVIAHLQGQAGIRRYLGDSYWAPDYKKKIKPEERTADVSDDLSSRNLLLPAVGQEAQWCLFDPNISCIFGQKFKLTRLPEHLTKQAEYLNRSLKQITTADQTDVPAFRCPELYYLESGRYISNDMFRFCGHRPTSCWPSSLWRTTACCERRTLTNRFNRRNPTLAA
jgi:hypothetical protein